MNKTYNPEDHIFNTSERKRSAGIEAEKVSQYTGLSVTIPCEVITNPKETTVLRALLAECKGNWLMGFALYITAKSQDAYGAYLPRKRQILQFYDCATKQGDMMQSNEHRYIGELSHVTAHEMGHAWFEDNAKQEVDPKNLGAIICLRMINEGVAIAIGDRTMRGIVDSEIIPFFQNAPAIDNRERKVKEYQYKDGGYNQFKIGHFDCESTKQLESDIEIAQKVIACYDKIQLKQLSGYADFLKLMPQLSEFLRGMYRIGSAYVQKKLSEYDSLGFEEAMKKIVASTPSDIREIREYLLSE